MTFKCHQIEYILVGYCKLSICLSVILCVCACAYLPYPSAWLLCPSACLSRQKSGHVSVVSICLSIMFNCVFAIICLSVCPAHLFFYHIHLPICHSFACLSYPSACVSWTLDLTPILSELFPLILHKDLCSHLSGLEKYQNIYREQMVNVRTKTLQIFKNCFLFCQKNGHVDFSNIVYFWVTKKME